MTTKDEKQLDLEDIEVQVETAEPIDVEIETPLDAKPDKATASAEPDKEPDAVEQLKAELAAAQARAAEAEALRAERDRLAAIATEKMREAAVAKGNAAVDQYNMIVGALRNAESERLALRRAYKEAFEIGDGDKCAEIQDQISELNIRVRDLDEGRQKIEEMAERQRRTAQQPRQTPVQQPVRQPEADVRQQFEAVKRNLSPASAAWLDQHSDAWFDPKKRERLSVLDGAAKYQGIAPDSPAYFAFFERELGYASRGQSDTRQTRPTSIAAPVSRDGGGPVRPSQVRLTAEEVELAKDWGMTPTEFARNKLEAQQKPWSVHNTRKGA